MLTLGRLMGVKTCILTMVTVLENLKEKLTGQERTDAEDLLCRTALEGIYHYHMKMEGEKNSKEKFSIGSETVIGMVHCLPLPTTAGFDGDYQKILDRAVQDAVTLEKAGVDAVIVENMGDTPFSALLNKAQLAALTAATLAVKNAVNIPVGVDAAFNDCEANIAIAAITGASFIRVPVFVDTVIFTDGVINPCAKKMYGISQSDGKRGHQSSGRCAGETCAYGTSIYYSRAVSERSSGQRSGWELS